MDIHVMTSRH